MWRFREVFFVCSDFKNKYPQLNEILNKTKVIRREEIMENLRVSDDFYNDILRRRKEKSIIFVGKLPNDIKEEFEKYMDVTYEQSIYELNTLYERAFCDAVELLARLDMLSNK